MTSANEANDLSNVAAAASDLEQEASPMDDKSGSSSEEAKPDMVVPVAEEQPVETGQVSSPPPSPDTQPAEVSCFDWKGSATPSEQSPCD